MRTYSVRPGPYKDRKYYSTSGLLLCFQTSITLQCHLPPQYGVTPSLQLHIIPCAVSGTGQILVQLYLDTSDEFSSQAEMALSYS